MRCAVTSARARDSGDMRARSSENFLVIAEPFASLLRQMLTLVLVSDAQYIASSCPATVTGAALDFHDARMARRATPSPPHETTYLPAAGTALRITDATSLMRSAAGSGVLSSSMSSSSSR